MIRKISSGDRELYMQMTGEFYNSDAVIHPIPEEYRENTFDELIRSDVYAECYIFEENGSAAGYALTAKTYSQEAGGLVIWLEELYVRPEYRSHGIGKQFFEYLTNLHAARFRLEVEPDNLRAVKLYDKLGFEDLPYMQMKKGN